MKSRRLFTCLALSTALFLSGCGSNAAPIYKDVLVPVGVDGTQFYYQHFAQLAQGAQYPSSLWVVDLETGVSRRLAPAEVRPYWIEVSGDYYVFPTTLQGTGNVTKSSLLAVQISTGERFTIFDELAEASFILDGSRVAYMADTPELVIYDLLTRAVLQRVALPEDASGVWGFRGNRVLTTRMTLPEGTADGSNAQVDGADLQNTEWTFLLIDLDTQEQTEFVAGPEGWVPMPLDNALSGDWVVTSGMDAASDGSSEAMEIVAWQISTGTGRSLAAYEPAATSLGRPPIAFAFVSDLSDTHAAVYRMTGLTWGTELIDVQSGERTVLVNGGVDSLFGSDTAIPFLSDNAAYWIDRNERSLVVYEISSGARSTITLGF